MSNLYHHCSRILILINFNFNNKNINLGGNIFIIWLLYIVLGTLKNYKNIFCIFSREQITQSLEVSFLRMWLLLTTISPQSKQKILASNKLAF